MKFKIRTHNLKYLAAVSNGLLCWSSEQMNETEKKIRGFKELKSGWHYGQGRPFKDAFISQSITLLSTLFGCGLEKSDAFPGLNGEIQVTAYRGADFFEFTLEHDGSWSFVRESNGQEIYSEDGLTLEQAKKLAKNCLKPVCDISDSSLSNTTGIRLSIDSAVWPSFHPVQTEEYQFLKGSAQNELPEVFASTQFITIRQ